MFDPLRQLGLGGGSRLLVGLAAVVCLLLGGAMLHKNLSFLAEARVVEGRVVRPLPGDMSDVQHGRHNFQVEYPGERGPRSHAINTSKRYSVGDRIVVGYLPSNPYAVREAGFGRMILIPSLYLIAGVVLGVLATLSLWRRSSSRRIERREGPSSESRSLNREHRSFAGHRQDSPLARAWSELDRDSNTTVEVFECTEEIFPCPQCGREVTVKDHAATPCPGCSAVWSGIPEAYRSALGLTSALDSTLDAVPDRPPQECADAGMPVYDPEEAARFVHGRLPRSTASLDDVRRILDLEAEFQESIGLTGAEPTVTDSEQTLDTTEMTEWIRRETARRGPSLSDAVIASVLDEELAYLESIGAVDTVKN